MNKYAFRSLVFPGGSFLIAAIFADKPFSTGYIDADIFLSASAVVYALAPRKEKP